MLEEKTLQSRAHIAFQQKFNNTMPQALWFCVPPSTPQLFSRFGTSCHPPSSSLEWTSSQTMPHDATWCHMYSYDFIWNMMKNNQKLKPSPQKRMRPGLSMTPAEFPVCRIVCCRASTGLSDMAQMSNVALICAAANWKENALIENATLQHNNIFTIHINSLNITIQWTAFIQVHPSPCIQNRVMFLSMNCFMFEFIQVHAYEPASCFCLWTAAFQVHPSFMHTNLVSCQSMNCLLSKFHAYKT